MKCEMLDHKKQNTPSLMNM